MLPSNPRPSRPNPAAVRPPVSNVGLMTHLRPPRAYDFSSSNVVVPPALFRTQPTRLNAPAPALAFMRTSAASSASSTYSAQSASSEKKRQVFDLEKNRSRFSIGSSRSSSTVSSLSRGAGQIALSADPELWVISPGTPGFSRDDWLHNPDPRRDLRNDRGGSPFTCRGIANLGCMMIMVVGVLFLFVGLPILNHFVINGAIPFGNPLFTAGVNGSGQIPIMNGNFGLIDRDTPKAAYTKSSYVDGTELELVFSDEFNVDGRTFYPGDDPYWEAENMWYWATNNLNWYDPETITTRNGSLVISLLNQESHGLKYEGGLISTWNKFCFTGGLFEVNVLLPGASDVAGLWPAVWSMGNLGRMGYGATLEGMWPYTYDSCDVGTLPNQTRPDGTPSENLSGNDPSNGGALSFLPGQKLSACTCQGEDHPGPRRPDGSFVGRGVPEIDVMEATINTKTKTGQVSQSAQWAPFNERYAPITTNATLTILEPNVAQLNTFVGGVFQQTTSALVDTNSCGYEAVGSQACFNVYGFEYKPGVDGYVTWISSGSVSWTISAAAMAPDATSGAGQRLVSEEPMYLIANLAISPSFSAIDFANLQFPSHMYIDYVRVYQPKGSSNVGCDTASHPTSEYIQKHIEAYTNVNLTTWAQYGQTFPKNNLTSVC